MTFFINELYGNRKYNFVFNDDSINKNLNETDEAEKFEELKRELLTKKQKVHEIYKFNREEWRKHTKKMHISSCLNQIFHDTKTSQAFWKFIEILTQFPQIIGRNVIEKGILNSMHLCEGPGNFLAALDRFLCTNYPLLEWNWKANTLNPYEENIESCEKLLDDTFIVNHLENWIFGSDNSGNLFKLNEENYLEEIKCSNCFDLITADGSIYAQNAPDQQESLVFPLIKAEIECALKMLAENGSFVLKMFTNYEKSTNELIRLLFCHFESCSMFKPLCSKSGNSEKYVICTKFRKNRFRSLISSKQILECEEMFTFQQVEAILENIQYFQCVETKQKRRSKNRKIDLFLQSINISQLSSPLRESHICPNFSTKNRPWFTMFGHNCIDRISNIKSYQEARESLKNISGNEIIDFCHYPNISFSNFQSIEKNFICTKESIKPNHSMFIDPIILHSINILDPKKEKFFDIFQNCSKIDQNYRGEKINNGENLKKMKFCCDNFQCFQQILNVIKLIIIKKIEEFTLEWNCQQRIPFIISRLSSSIFCLFVSLFKNVEIDKHRIVFNFANLDNHSDILQLLSRLCSSSHHHQINGQHVRNFASLHTHATIHPLLFHFNCLACESFLKF